MIFGLPATLVWSLIFGVALAVEVWTIVDQRRGNTASVSFFWRARAVPLTRALLVGTFAWFIYHFFFEWGGAMEVLVDDYTIVLSSALATLVRTEARSGK